MSGARTPVIDVHVHAAPRRYLKALAQITSVEERDGAFLVADIDQMGGPLRLGADFHEPERLLARLDACGVDIGVVSLATMMLGYQRPTITAVRLAEAANAGLAEFAATGHGRFRWLATVPFQDLGQSLRILGDAMRAGASGVQIGSNVNGRNLDDPVFAEFFTAAAELRAFVLVHSVDCLAPQRLARHYLSNIVGNPYESGLAVGSVIFGRVLERAPGLRLCFCHGGGAAPAMAARWDRAWAIGRLDGTTLERAPSSYFRDVWFDSLVYGEEQLRLLTALAGTDRVLLGSDTPFPIADPEPVARLRRIAWLSDDQRNAILGANVAPLLAD